MAPPRRFPQLYDEEWLTQRYVTEHRSQVEIATELGCSRRLVGQALDRFGIEARGSRFAELSREDLDAWLERGGVDENRPYGPEEHKAVLMELGLARIDELLVLQQENDPFYVGTPRHLQFAEWFTEHWKASGSLGHLRRLHYRLLSGEEDVEFPDGKPYLNNMACFNRLCQAGSWARHLGLVEAETFEDRRNPDPTINAHTRMFDPEPHVEIDELGQAWAMALPKVPGPYFLDVGPLKIPEPIVTGYDYDAADQPVLVEVWIEKTTMNDILGPLCRSLGANLVAASGMQSITNSVRLLERCREHGKPAHIIYISDFDRAGDTMPRAVARQLEFYCARDFPDVEVTLDPVALTEQQVEDLDLPRRPSVHARQSDAEKFDEGIVELDALEALHPGYLAQIVRDAIEPHQDDWLVERLTATEDAALQGAGEQWVQETAELREGLDELAAEAKEIAEPFRARLTELYYEFERAIAPVRKRERELESTLDECWEAFVPDLPERPEAEPPDVDDDVLFDSRRHWLDQLERYKED